MYLINTLEADSINLNFGERPILSDIYVKTETHKITGFLGRNGSGKSCLMQIIFGTMAATNKSVRINTKYTPQPFAVKGLIRYLPQHHFTPKHLKVQEISNLYEVPLDLIFEEFPFLEKIKMKKMGDLSSGEQRIFEIMLVLKSAVKFVILDEPFSALMPIHAEKVKKLIFEEKDKKGIILTDHQFQHIMDLSDNLYLIREGKSFKINALDDLLELGYISHL